MHINREHVNFVGSLCSVIAIVISGISLLRVDRLDGFIHGAGPLGMDISVTAPAEGREVNNYVIPIEGRVSIAHFDNAEPHDVNLALAQRRIEIVPLVRPLSAANQWWVQTKPAVDREGHLQGSINIGGPDGEGIGKSFQIILIAVPKGTVSQGSMLRDLPTFGATSRSVTVARLK